MRPIKFLSQMNIKGVGQIHIKGCEFNQKRCEFKIFQNLSERFLNNSNYDKFHGGGGFSHPYVIMHKYFVKRPKMQKMNT